MDVGSLTWTQIWVRAIHTKGGWGACQAQISLPKSWLGRIKKTSLSPCPTRGSNPGSSDLNADTLTTELRTPPLKHYSTEVVGQWSHVLRAGKRGFSQTLRGWLGVKQQWSIYLPIEPWSRQGEGACQFFWVDACGGSSVPVSPSSAQHALRLLRSVMVMRCITHLYRINMAIIIGIMSVASGKRKLPTG